VLHLIGCTNSAAKRDASISVSVAGWVAVTIAGWVAVTIAGWVAVTIARRVAVAVSARAFSASGLGGSAHRARFAARARLVAPAPVDLSRAREERCGDGEDGGQDEMLVEVRGHIWSEHLSAV
jgi:hypothetical protein